METLAVNLLQTTPVGSVNRTDSSSAEFSNILSGKEPMNRAESPPGRSSPPDNKMPVEGEENHEPNAQSQDPDFHQVKDSPTNEEGESTTPQSPKQDDESPENDSTPVAIDLAQLLIAPQLPFCPLPDGKVLQTESGTGLVVGRKDPKVEVAQLEMSQPMTQTVESEVDLSSLINSQVSPNSTSSPTPKPLTSQVTGNIAAPQASKERSEVKVSSSEASIERLISENQVPTTMSMEFEPTTQAEESVAAVPSELRVANEKVQSIISQQGSASQDQALSTLSTVPETEIAIQTNKPGEVEGEAKTDEEPKARSSNISIKPMTATAANAQQLAPSIASDNVKQVSAKTIGDRAKTVQPETQSRTEGNLTSNASQSGKADEASTGRGKEGSQGMLAGSEEKPLRSASTEDKAIKSKVQAADLSMETVSSPKSESVAAASPSVEGSEVKASKLATPVSPSISRPIIAEKVIQQVVDRIENLAATHQRNGVTIRLDPIDLGQITMVVRTIGNQIDAQIYASDERVRTTLDTNRTQLASALDSKGFNLRNVSISDQQSNGNYTQMSSNNQHTAHQQTRQDQQQVLRQQALGLVSRSASPDGEAIIQQNRRFVQQNAGIDLLT